MPVASLTLDDVHRFSMEEYHRLIEAGAFDEDAHAELIDGLLVTTGPKTPRHEEVLRRLTRCLHDSLDRDADRIGVRRPLTLGASEPEPDLCVVPGDAPVSYHPAAASLVVDVESGRVVVHRGPGPKGYSTVTEVRDSLRATALALPPLDVRALLRIGT